MTSIIKYTAEKKDEWNAFVKASKNGLFMFDRNYMEYHSDRFKDHSLMFYSDDKLVSVLPMSEHGDELISHGGLTFGGFITDGDMKQHRMLDLFDALLEYTAQNGYRQVTYKAVPHMYHRISAEEDLYALFRHNAVPVKVEPSVILNLKNPVSMTKGRKGHIRRAKREGVVVSESEDFDTYIDLVNSVLMEHHNAKAVHTGEELKLLKSRFPEQIHLITGSLNDEMIAGIVLFEYEDLVHTQYIAANDTARTIGGLDLVISTIIDTYQESKRWLDFGISTEQGGRVLNEGLIYQKEGFGGRVEVYTTWLLKP